MGRTDRSYDHPPRYEDAFWALIEQSAQETGTRKARLIRLEEQLTELPLDDIIDFQKWFSICECGSNQSGRPVLPRPWPTT
ncbi:DUF4240 domain-containing protein [Nonomuraea fuscirosea]|uniref:DUF4240 domain-containing protein n=1 Tax=Nonomuraea fuscirosea TaxID=1291556 RepID=UPI00389AD211